MARPATAPFVLVLLAGCGDADPAAEAKPAPMQEAETRNGEAIADWVRERYEFQGELPDFETGMIDLDGDGRSEVLVYVTGRDWCGTGGCNLAVLRRGESGLEAVGDLTVVRPPIGAFETGRNGWRDLAVWAGGRKPEDAGMARVPFVDGAYASNPTVHPATKSRDPFETVIERRKLD